MLDEGAICRDKQANFILAGYHARAGKLEK
jgi:hypothetical protein